MRAVSDIRTLLNAGADKVSINTAAIFNPELVKEAADRFGSQCIVVAMDVKDLGDGSGRYELFTHGGRKETGLEAVAWAEKMAEFGAGEIFAHQYGSRRNEGRLRPRNYPCYLRCG